MKTGHLLWFAVTLTGALTGCASKSVPKDFSLDPGKKEGIVVVSASHDLPGGRATRAAFFLNGGPSEEHGGLLFSMVDVVPGVIPGGSDLEDGYGKIYALSLPAGRHRINSWNVKVGNAVTIRPTEDPLPLDFQINAGEIKYIGNLHANLQTGKNIFGMTVVGNGYPEVRDERQRDIALFEEKYPQFKDRAVIDLLRLGPWMTGAENRHQINVPPMPPVPAYIHK